jgi:hypothetical protein
MTHQVQYTSKSQEPLTLRSLRTEDKAIYKSVRDTKGNSLWVQKVISLQRVQDQHRTLSNSYDPQYQQWTLQIIRRHASPSGVSQDVQYGSGTVGRSQE